MPQPPDAPAPCDAPVSEMHRSSRCTGLRDAPVSEMHRGIRFHRIDSSEWGRSCLGLSSRATRIGRRARKGNHIGMLLSDKSKPRPCLNKRARFGNYAKLRVLVLVLSEAVLVIERSVKGRVKGRVNRLDGRARAPSQATEHEHGKKIRSSSRTVIQRRRLSRSVTRGCRVSSSLTGLA